MNKEKRKKKVCVKTMSEQLQSHYHYVVIGGGVAGVSCVRQLAIELEAQGIEIHCCGANCTTYFCLTALLQFPKEKSESMDGDASPKILLISASRVLKGVSGQSSLSGWM